MTEQNVEKVENVLEGLVERALEVQWHRFERLLKCEMNALPDLVVKKFVAEIRKEGDSHNSTCLREVRSGQGIASTEVVKKSHSKIVKPPEVVKYSHSKIVKPPGDDLVAGFESSEDVVKSSSRIIIPENEVRRKVDKAVPSTVKSMLDGGILWSSPDMSQACFSRFVDGPIFSSISSVAILANTVYTGYETSQRVQNEVSRLGSGPQVSLSIIPEYVFILFFTTELMMRMVAQKTQFLLGKDLRWNMFDSVLIAFSVIQLTTKLGSSLTVFRVFRIFRVVRLLKVINRVDALKSLNLMVDGIVNCVVPLFWACTTLIIIMYAFGVFFMSVVGNYLVTLEVSSMGDVLNSQLVAALDTKFGSMYKSICLLFEGISGGNDWAGLAEELAAIGEGYYVCFALYIVFVTFGVLNIVTGFFVEGAVQASVETRAEILKAKEEKRAMMAQVISEVFHESDDDLSGRLTFDELERHLECFKILDLEPRDATQLFVLLDTTCAGSVDIDEFVRGCLRVMGNPKNLDICTCMYQNDKILHLLEALASSTQCNAKEAFKLV